MSLINRKEIKNTKLIVVKVGSKILAPQKNGEHLSRFASIAKSISQLIDDGKKVILVSSGAVANGRAVLGLTEKPKTISLKQACAGVGQIELMNLYRKEFNEHKKPIGQILLSSDDLGERKRYLNLQHTLNTMLKNEIVPIINENDSVSVDEIKIGDNDTLASKIAIMANADLFVMLSDINGLYTDNPKTNPEAKHIPLYNSDLIVNASKDGTDVGTGGMETKLNAAKRVCRAGITAIVGDGFCNDLISVINNKELGTLFLPCLEEMNSHDRFLYFIDTKDKKVTVDDGAKKAILSGKSLLPAGILSVSGKFSEDDIISIENGGEIFAKGYTDYSSVDIKKIKGQKSSEIKRILGSYRHDFVVSRNNMVVL